MLRRKNLILILAVFLQTFPALATAQESETFNQSTAQLIAELKQLGRSNPKRVIQLVEGRKYLGSSKENLFEYLQISRMYSQALVDNEDYVRGCIVFDDIKKIAIRESQSLNLKSGIMHDCVISLYRISDYSTAFRLGKQTLALRKIVSSLKDIAETTAILGVLYKHTGQYELAVQYFEDALSLSVKAGNLRGQMIVLNNFAGLFAKSKALDEAIEMYLQAIEIAESADLNSYLVSFYMNISSVYQDIGEFEKSKQSLEKAQEINLVVKSERREKLIINRFASLNIKLNKLNGVLKQLRQNVIYFQQRKEIKASIETINLIAEYFQQSGAINQSIEESERALTIAQESNLKYMTPEILSRLSDLNYEAYDFKTAFDWQNLVIYAMRLATVRRLLKRQKLTNIV